MAFDLTLHAQRPSPARLILPAVGSAFMAGLTVVTISDALAGSASGVGIGLTLVMMAATAWLVRDLLKLLGVVPAARIELSDDSLSVRSAMFGLNGRRRTLALGQTIRMDVLRQPSLFLGATGLYRLSQQDVQVTIVAPGMARDEDLEALLERLAESGTRVDLIEHRSRREGGPGPSR